MQGQPVDRPPVGFWLHFPKDKHHGDAAVRTHLEFMNQTGTDILKVMNENILYDGTSKILSTADIPKFRPYGRHDRQFVDQMDIIKRIAEQAKGEYPIIATIHGLLASIFHATGFSGNFTSMGYGLAIFCREKPAEMRGVLDMFTETLMDLVDCSLEAGADGIFYAALGGEAKWFLHDEYMETVAPFEQLLYAHIKEKTPYNILHICKSDIDFERYTQLEPAVVNWSIYQNHLSLTEGQKLFPNSVILGGFPDRTGVLVTGTPAEILDHTRHVLEEMNYRNIIVGSDCTLPTGIDPARIRHVVDSVYMLTSKVE